MPHLLWHTRTHHNFLEIYAVSKNTHQQAGAVASKRAGFIRRFAAMIYDTLVAVAVGMCAGLVIVTLLVVLLKNAVLALPPNTEPSVFIQSSLLYQLVIQGWVMMWVVIFFLWFWKNGGQTLGMRAWRLRLFSTNERPLTWRRLVLRMLVSLCGLGTLLVLLDRKHRLSLQDRIAHTEILTLTPQENDHKQW